MLPKLIFTFVALAFIASLLNQFGIVYRMTGGALGTDPRARPAVVAPAAAENPPAGS